MSTKIKTSRAALQAALKEACYFANAKSAMPILHKALFRPTADGLLVAATDLSRTVSARLVAEISGDADAVVDARKALEVLKVLPGTDVEVEINGPSVTLAAGRGKFKLPAIQGKDFPKLPAPPAALDAFPADALAYLLAKTETTVSRDETRIALNCALLEVEGAIARAVSTDGHRLTKVERSVSTKFQTGGALIPLRAVADLERLLKDCTGKRAAALSLAIGMGNLYASHTVDGVTWLHSFRLTDAKFPPYNQVIPTEHQHSLECGREELTDVLKRLSVTASKKTGGCRISVPQRAESRYDGTFVTATLTTDDGDGNTGSEEVEFTASGFAHYKPRPQKSLADGKPVEAAPTSDFGVSLRYLGDALDLLEGSRVSLSFNELDPCLVRSANSDDGVTAVVMPMRL